LDFIIFTVAMGALVYGADFIIRESERIALHFNISHFVIGATLIAFGTSLPEMAASMMASAQGKSDMAIANVVGSVLFNITLVLGVVFLIAKKMNPDRNLFSQDSGWVLMPVIVFILMIQDGEIGRFDGVLFLSMMAAYLFFLFSDSKEELDFDVDEELVKEKFAWTKTVILLIIGFALTIGGANFVVESGSNIARTFGVSEWIIGIVLISLGTSLPELVVSIVAVRKGNADMSIGNIIGSNVANFSMVLGGASLLSPLHVDMQTSQFDIYMMIAASLTLLLVLANKLYNRSGAILLLILLSLFIQHTINSF
jgi:cation:H+ antiporter